MALITLNSLPSPGTVVRANGDVYHWYQTNDIIPPFDPITPIDHGYFVLSFETGPIGDGFLPDPDVSGWLEIDYLPVDLIEEELTSSAGLSVTAIGSYIPAASSSSTFGFGRLSINEISAVSNFDISYTKLNETSISTSSLFKSRIVDNEFSISVQPNIVGVRGLAYSEILKTDISGISNRIDVTGISAGITEPEIVTTFSPVAVSDINGASYVYSDTRSLTLVGRGDLYSDTSYVTLTAQERITTFSDNYVVDIYNSVPSYSDITTVTLSPEVHTIHTSQDITTDITATPRVQSTQTSTVQLRLEEVVTYYAPNTFILIPSTSKKLVNTPVVQVNTLDAVVPIIKSGITTSSINSGKSELTYSDTRYLSLHSGSESFTKLVYASTVQVDITSASKQYSYSSLTDIDIAFTGEVRILTDQDWIMLKRFGTRGWKFLSYLEYFDVKEIASDLDISVISNIGSIFTNATFIDVIYDQVETTRVDRIIKYKDEQHTQVLEEMNITYASGILTRVEILQYSSQGILFRTITEDFEFNALTSEVISSGFVVTDVGQFGALALPITPGYGEGTGLYDVLVGDAVFINTSGFIERTDATDADKSQVTGFVFQINGQSAVILSSGIISGYTALTVGASYFLNPNLPGKITKFPPAAGSGNILKFVGTAITPTSLNIDLSQRMVIRTT